MKFVITDWSERGGPGDFMLIPDTWDDYSYQTRFTLVYAGPPAVIIGHVKILVRASTDDEPVPITRTVLEPSFETLEPTLACSVGQDNAYYERLARLPDQLGREALRRLHDVAFSLTAPHWWSSTSGWEFSLVRENTAILAWAEAPGILRGEIADGTTRKIVPYKRDEAGMIGGPGEVTFLFDGGLRVPGRLNVLVGKNGTGKTSVLAGMKRWLSSPQPKGRWNHRPNFLKVLIVSFNPFDDIYFEDSWKNERANVRFVGFRPSGLRLQGLRSSVSVGDDWATQLRAVFPDVQALLDQLPGLSSEAETIEALTRLQPDEEWRAFLSEALEGVNVPQLLALNPADAYGRMSAGQRALVSIYALIFGELNENVLVVVDEPENHLHPSLVARFIRHLNVLLDRKRGFGLIATHSPVIVQETCSRFVWVLTRTGNQTEASHPNFETFGASIELISEQLFETDFTSSHWKHVLRELAASGATLSEAEAEIGDKPLSPLARSYLAFHLARRGA